MNNNQNFIQTKSYNFALKIISLYHQLINGKKEYILAKQILRCGTSIGANVEEAIGGQTKKDFLMKCTIAYKEARETPYWLRLLKDSQTINTHTFINLHNDLDEILKLLTAIQKTTRNNLKNNNYALVSSN